jgi:Na+-driven multidrug efflux pump
LIKIVALIHFLDGTQGLLNGILRSVGAQFYGSIAIFVGFYVVGSPISLSLMLKTNLQIYGTYIIIFFILINLDK